MTPLVFLIAALILSVVGSVVYWLWAREPSSLESSVDSFNKGLAELGTRAARTASDEEFGPDSETPRGPGVHPLDPAEFTQLHEDGST